MNPPLSPANRQAVRTLVEQPELLGALKFELMLDLAQNHLTGLELAEALRLRDTDPQCAAFLAAARDLFAAPPLLSSAARPVAPDFANSLLSALVDRLREMYAQLNTPDLSIAAPGAGEVTETSVSLGDVTALLRRHRRADKSFDIELIVPAAAGLTPDALAGFSLRIVDRPDLLVFHRRPDGSYAATAVLPPQLSYPDKQLVVVPPAAGEAG